MTGLASVVVVARHCGVFDKDVSVTWFKQDRYGRTVGQVRLDDTDVCLEQIKRGMA